MSGTAQHLALVASLGTGFRQGVGAGRMPPGAIRGQAPEPTRRTLLPTIRMAATGGAIAEEFPRLRPGLTIFEGRSKYAHYGPLSAASHRTAAFPACPHSLRTSLAFEMDVGFPDPPASVIVLLSEPESAIVMHYVSAGGLRGDPQTSFSSLDCAWCVRNGCASAVPCR